MWPGGPKIRTGGAFPIGTDAMLLADFVNLSGISRACDLGSGSGIIALLLALRRENLLVTGLELDGTAAEYARQSAAMNGLDRRVAFITGDLRRHRELFPAGAFDLVVSNPPYYPVGSGKAPASPAAAAARSEDSCTLEQLCQAASFLTRFGGRFALVHKPEHLSRVLCTLSGAGLEPKRLRMVHNDAASAPNLFLTEARRGGKPGLVIEPPLLLTDGAGNDSEELRRIYHRR